MRVIHNISIFIAILSFIGIVVNLLQAYAWKGTLLMNFWEILGHTKFGLNLLIFIINLIIIFST